MGETLARHISKAGRRSGSDSTNNSDSDSGGLGPKRGVYPQVVHHVLMPCKFPRRRTAPLLIVQLYLLDASAGYQLRTGSLWEAPMLRVPFVRARCWGPPANLSLLFDTLCRQPQHQRLVKSSRQALYPAIASSRAAWDVMAFHPGHADAAETAVCISRRGVWHPEAGHLWAHICALFSGCGMLAHTAHQ